MKFFAFSTAVFIAVAQAAPPPRVDTSAQDVSTTCGLGQGIVPAGTNTNVPCTGSDDIFACGDSVVQFDAKHDITFKTGNHFTVFTVTCGEQIIFHCPAHQSYTTGWCAVPITDVTAYDFV